MEENLKKFFEAKPIDGKGKVIGEWRPLFDLAVYMARREKGAVSVHTGVAHIGPRRWGGYDDLINEARELAPDVDLLAKGIHMRQEQVNNYLSRGATSVLTVDYLPKDNADKCLIEISDPEWFKRLPKDLKYVYNSRALWALITGRIPEKRMSFAEVRERYPDFWICQASNLNTVADVNPRANAILVGTHLRKFSESLIYPDTLPVGL